MLCALKAPAAATRDDVIGPSLDIALAHGTLVEAVHRSLLRHTQIDVWVTLVARLARQRVFRAGCAGVDAAPQLVARLDRVRCVL
jgi:hypothetical protein